MIIVTLVNYREYAVFLHIEISGGLAQGCVKVKIRSKIPKNKIMIWLPYSSPVMSSPSKFGLASRCSRMTQHPCMMVIIQQFQHHFCTHLMDGQFFSSTLPFTVPIHVQFISDQFSSLLAITIDYLPVQLRVELIPGY